MKNTQRGATKKDSKSDFVPDMFNTQIRPVKDIEEAIIAALLIDINALGEVADILKAEMFYYGNLQTIYEIILFLDKKKIGVDLLTVTEELKRRNKLEEVGGAFFIAQLTSRVSTATHILSHVRILQENYLERRVAQVGLEIYKKAVSKELDAFDLLDFTGKKISEVADTIQGNNQSTMASAVMDELKMIESRMAKADTGGILGVPSGFRDLDAITGGWQKSDLIIMAGRPAMGKTAATLSIARNAAVMGGFGVGFFSLEMSTGQLTVRLMAAEAEIENEKLRNGRLNATDYVRLTGTIDDLTKANLIIDDTPALTVMELKTRARRMKAQYNIGMIIIDYLQLMSGSGKYSEGSREQEISSISRQLKALAKELDIPVIALSQLSRAVETRGGDHKPILSDLRESGSIEQDADIVIFLYRPEYYGIPNTDGSDSKGVAEFIIAKHRNGSLKDVRLRFVPEYTKFKNWEYSQQPEHIDNVVTDTQPSKKKEYVDPPSRKLTPLSKIIAESNEVSGGMDDDTPF